MSQRETQPSQIARAAGRWMLETRDIADRPHTIAWGEFVDGKVPVVPCDERAVDRVAQAVAEDHFDRKGIDGCNAEQWRDLARRYLTAASGRP